MDFGRDRGSKSECALNPRAIDACQTGNPNQIVTGLQQCLPCGINLNPRDECIGLLNTRSAQHIRQRCVSFPDARTIEQQDNNNSNFDRGLNFDESRSSERVLSRSVSRTSQHSFSTEVTECGLCVNKHCDHCSCESCRQCREIQDAMNNGGSMEDQSNRRKKSKFDSTRTNKDGFDGDPAGEVRKEISAFSIFFPRDDEDEDSKLKKNLKGSKSQSKEKKSSSKTKLGKDSKSNEERKSVNKVTSRSILKHGRDSKMAINSDDSNNISNPLPEITYRHSDPNNPNYKIGFSYEEGYITTENKTDDPKFPFSIHRQSRKSNFPKEYYSDVNLKKNGNNPNEQNDPSSLYSDDHIGHDGRRDPTNWPDHKPKFLNQPYVLDKKEESSKNNSKKKGPPKWMDLKPGESKNGLKGKSQTNLRNGKDSKIKSETNLKMENKEGNVLKEKSSTNLNIVNDPKSKDERKVPKGRNRTNVKDGGRNDPIGISSRIYLNPYRQNDPYKKKKSKKENGESDKKNNDPNSKLGNEMVENIKDPKWKNGPNSKFWSDPKSFERTIHPRFNDPSTNYLDDDPNNVHNNGPNGRRDPNHWPDHSSKFRNNSYQIRDNEDSKERIDPNLNSKDGKNQNISNDEDKKNDSKGISPMYGKNVPRKIFRTDYLEKEEERRRRIVYRDSSVSVMDGINKEFKIKKILYETSSSTIMKLRNKEEVASYHLVPFYPSNHYKVMAVDRKRIKKLIEEDEETDKATKSKITNLLTSWSNRHMGETIFISKGKSKTSINSGIYLRSRDYRKNSKGKSSTDLTKENHLKNSSNDSKGKSQLNLVSGKAMKNKNSNNDSNGKSRSNLKLVSGKAMKNRNSNNNSKGRSRTTSASGNDMKSRNNSRNSSMDPNGRSRTTSASGNDMRSRNNSRNSSMDPNGRSRTTSASGNDMKSRNNSSVSKGRSLTNLAHFGTDRNNINGDQYGKIRKTLANLRSQSNSNFLKESSKSPTARNGNNPNDDKGIGAKKTTSKNKPTADKPNISKKLTVENLDKPKDSNKGAVQVGNSKDGSVAVDIESKHLLNLGINLVSKSGVIRKGKVIAKVPGDPPSDNLNNQVSIPKKSILTNKPSQDQSKEPQKKPLQNQTKGPQKPSQNQPKGLQKSPQNQSKGPQKPVEGKSKEPEKPQDKPKEPQKKPLQNQTKGPQKPSQNQPKGLQKSPQNQSKGLQKPVEGKSKEPEKPQVKSKEPEKPQVQLKDPTEAKKPNLKSPSLVNKVYSEEGKPNKKKSITFKTEISTEIIIEEVPETKSTQGINIEDFI